MEPPLLAHTTLDRWLAMLEMAVRNRDRMHDYCRPAEGRQLIKLPLLVRVPSLHDGKQALSPLSG